jgi:Fungal Zn(2)-Cys(6) binuclear cluster domain
MHFFSIHSLFIKHQPSSRNRKIRCDGAQPVCHSCGLRQGEECIYDPAPKRRGPDKTPGARQRIAQYRKGLMEGDYVQAPPGRRRRRTAREKAAEQRETPAELVTWIAAPSTAGPSKPTPSFPKSPPDPPSYSGRPLIWTGDQGFASLYHQESHANNAISHLTSKVLTIVIGPLVLSLCYLDR